MVNLLIREPILFKLPITAMRFIEHARRRSLATPCMTCRQGKKFKRRILARYKDQSISPQITCSFTSFTSTATNAYLRRRIDVSRRLLQALWWQPAHSPPSRPWWADPRCTACHGLPPPCSRGCACGEAPWDGRAWCSVHTLSGREPCPLRCTVASYCHRPLGGERPWRTQEARGALLPSGASSCLVSSTLDSRWWSIKNTVSPLIYRKVLRENPHTNLMLGMLKISLTRYSARWILLYMGLCMLPFMIIYLFYRL